MTKALAWLRPRDASLDELRAQHAHAQAAHETALQAIAGAKRTFADTGSEASRKALQAAREGAVQTADDLQRAVDLRAEAEEAQKLKDREAKRLRRDDLRKALTDTVRRRELVADEVGAWKLVVTARLARIDHERTLGYMVDEAARLDTELGEAPVRLNVHNEAAVAYLTFEALAAESRTLPAGPQREILEQLARLR